MLLQINPLLDVKYLNQVYGDDATIIHLIFDAFISDSLPRWNNLEIALKENNMVEAASIVHGLKPSFTMAGLTNLRTKVDALELAIKENTDIEILRSSYQKISDELRPLIPVLESESKRLAHL